MHKNVQMGETKVQIQAEGVGGQTCFITRAVMGSPHTPRSPTGAEGIAHNTLLTTSKICGICAKKKYCLEKKKVCEFFLVRNISFSAEYFFTADYFF